MSPIFAGVRHLLSSTKRAMRFQQNRFRTNGEIFDTIYKQARWGGKPGEIYSGSGSEGAAAEAYVEAVLNFVREVGCSRVVDIGCGDFRIGKQIAAAVPRYVGLDVSRLVIERNRRLYFRDGISFEVGDAQCDPLPPGDICLIRQVLQHLPNKSIKTILNRVVAQYPYVVVAEHMPAQKNFTAFNLDIPAGADIRVGYGSGVYVDQAPFDLPIYRVLLDVPLTREQSYRTVYSPSDPSSWEHLKTAVIQGTAL